MKKSLLLLVLISIMLIFVVPQVNASDRDVGFTYVQPADNAINAVDCQACGISSGCIVYTIIHQDPGDMCGEAVRVDFNLPAPHSGDINDLLTASRNLDRLFMRQRCLIKTTYNRVISTSNGGAGY